MRLYEEHSFYGMIKLCFRDEFKEGRRMQSLNELLAKSEDRRRFFMRDSVIPSEPDTRPRDEEKRDAGYELFLETP